MYVSQKYKVTWAYQSFKSTKRKNDLPFCKSFLWVLGVCFQLGLFYMGILKVNVATPAGMRLNLRRKHLGWPSYCRAWCRWSTNCCTWITSICRISSSCCCASCCLFCLSGWIWTLIWHGFDFRLINVVSGWCSELLFGYRLRADFFSNPQILMFGNLSLTLYMNVQTGIVSLEWTP